MLSASDVKLFSGGLGGAEAEFGAQAEKWGVQEVNFTYDGHTPTRMHGLVTLGPEEMQRGDISMEIVCMRMNRSYSNAEAIRKVMQMIFHMVNSGFQVFAVGWIQSNDTVKGGTGWAVELAKLFNRPLSVFDQDRRTWFSWKDNAWVESLPVIEHKTFVGTGTRNLSEDGARAIADLFERSFRR
ncbi:MAG: hypothetical protein MUC41_16450 [Syntrophobacteraceae bacterium]|jgi:hypothetical protein|nr:hypothetical protein [Syntrophobacteraceae bacterium]